MKNQRCLLLAVAVFVASGTAKAQSAYATDTNSNLYLVNLATGNTTLVGPQGVFLEGLAIDPSGTSLYGTDSAGGLYSLSLMNGAATLLGANTLGNQEGLDFAGGNLWSSDFNSPTGLHQLNTANGAVLQTVPTTAATQARAMAFNLNFTVAYTVNDNPNGGQDLWGTTSGGVSTDIGALHSQSLVAAIDLDPNTNTLYSLDVAGNIGTINQGTGALTLTGNNTGGQFWTDMTIVPVPEPASMVAMGLGLVGVLTRRRRQ